MPPGVASEPLAAASSTFCIVADKCQAKTSMTLVRVVAALVSIAMPCERS